MRRDRFYIGVAVFMAIVVATFVGLYIIGQQKRDAAVDKLRAKAFPVAQQTSTPEPTETHPPETNPPEMPIPESGKVTEEQYDTIAAFEALGKKMRDLRDDPLWREIIWNKKRSEWTEEEWGLITKYMDANRTVTLEIRRLANTSGPLHECDYVKDYVRDIPGLRPDFQHYRHTATYRNCDSWLSLDAYVAAAQGDYERAIEDYTAMLDLSNMLKEDSAVISQLTRIVMADVCYANINENIRGEDLSPDMIKNIVMAAYDTGDRDSFASAVATEGMLNLDKFDGIRHRNLNGTGLKPEGADAYLMHYYGSTLARPLLNMDEDVYAETMNQMSEAMLLPYYEAKPILDRINADIAELPQTRVLSRMLLPDIPGVADAQARHEATLGLMQVGLSIEHYHGQHGTYPETLEEIAPILGGPIPIDPYTGQPFVYEPRQNDFTLYSARGSVVGPGNRPVPPWYNEQGDIVWRYTGE